MRVLQAILAACAAVFLSGCMALAFAPIAASFADKPASVQYTTSAKKAAVFNAALKVLTAKGTAETIDRETGTLRGSAVVSAGQVAYSITIFVEERGSKTFLRVDTKLETMAKFELKNATDIAGEVAQEIERQLGSKLERA